VSDLEETIYTIPKTSICD